MIARRVEPELLDSLAADDPRAIHSRRDLRVINKFMGNSRHLAHAIQTLKNPPKRILELGAGDGTLVLKLAASLPAPLELFLLDMQPVVAPGTLQALEASGSKVQIVSARLQDWLASSQNLRFDLVIANLFLHHFTDAELTGLFRDISAICDAFVSCDPRRWLPALWSTPLLRLLGCNSVTSHDAFISVRAGFRDRELTALWPSSGAFRLSESPAGLASHLFLAERNRPL